MNYMLMPLRRYADFSGRSRRKEFWLWQLFNLVVIGILYSILAALAVGAMSRSSEAGGLTTDFDAAAQPDPNMFMNEFGAGGLLVTLLLLLYGLLVFIPSLAVAIRRFHDQDKSGWFILLGLIPFVGGLILLVFYLLPGTPGPNRFGPDPKGHGGYDRTFA